MRLCRYCGEEILKSQRSKEHVIPNSIGCNIKIKDVCSGCNNGVLSQLDTELRMKSPLQYLLYTSERSDWSFNPDYPYPLEHNIINGYKQNTIWPQLLFPGSQYTFFFAPERGISPKQYANTFLNSLSVRIQNYGIKALIWEKMRGINLTEFPTRVFTRHTFSEINPKIHFFCRHSGSINKDDFLNLIEIAKNKFKRAKASPVITPGLKEVPGEYSCDIIKVQRALTKIGVNALAYICSNTAINRETLSQAIQFVRYGHKNYRLSTTWFINNKDIQWMDCPENQHKIHIEPINSFIKIHISFFGGKAGALVLFPGRINENWRRAEITLGSGNTKAKISKSNVYRSYPNSRITIDPREIMPSVPFTRMDTKIEIVRKG